jgi:hypothetical protein
LWIHDVLLVQRGLLCPRTIALPVCRADRPIRGTDRSEVGGLGVEPVVLSLTLDDGRSVDVAARNRDLDALAGPFLAVLIPGLPQAPTEPQARGS